MPRVVHRLATEADPATPYPHAEAVAARLEEGHLLTQTGGPHVVFGWGNPCVDDAVTRFGLDAEIPPQPSCPGSLLSPYLALLSPAVADLPAEEMLAMVDLEIFYLPELVVWDRSEEMVVGCPHGGDITFTGDDDTTSFQLDGCGLVAGLALSGEGEWNFEQGSTDLSLTMEGTGCSYRWKETWEDGAFSIDVDCP